MLRVALGLSRKSQVGNLSVCFLISLVFSLSSPKDRNFQVSLQLVFHQAKCSCCWADGNRNLLLPLLREAGEECLGSCAGLKLWKKACLKKLLPVYSRQLTSLTLTLLGLSVELTWLHLALCRDSQHLPCMRLPRKARIPLQVWEAWLRPFSAWHDYDQEMRIWSYC